MEFIRKWNNNRQLNNYIKNLQVIDSEELYVSIRRIYNLLETKYEELGSREKLNKDTKFWSENRNNLLIVDNNILKISLIDIEKNDGNNTFHIIIDSFFEKDDIFCHINLALKDFIFLSVNSKKIPCYEKLGTYVYHIGISIEEIVSFVKGIKMAIIDYYRFLSLGYKIIGNKHSVMITKRIDCSKIATWTEKIMYTNKDIQQYLYYEIERWLDVDISPRKSEIDNAFSFDEIEVRKKGEDNIFFEIVKLFLFDEIDIIFGKVNFEEAEFYCKKVEKSLENVFDIINSRIKVRKIVANIAKRIERNFLKKDQKQYIKQQYTQIIQRYTELQKKGEYIESEFNIKYLNDCISNLDSDNTLGLIARHSALDIIKALSKGDVKKRHYFYFNKLLLGLTKPDNTERKLSSINSEVSGGETESQSSLTENLGGVLVTIVSNRYVDQAINYFREYTEKTGDISWIYLIISSSSNLSLVDIDTLSKLLELVDKKVKKKFLKVYYKKLLKIDLSAVKEGKTTDLNKYKYCLVDRHFDWILFYELFYEDYKNKILENKSLAKDLKEGKKTIEEILIELGYNKYEFYDKIIEEIYKTGGYLEQNKIFELSRFK